MAQRRGKTCESGREQGNRGREIIKGKRGRNIKRGARKTNQKSQVKGVASVGNSKSKRRRKVIGIPPCFSQPVDLKHIKNYT